MALQIISRNIMLVEDIDMDNEVEFSIEKPYNDIFSIWLNCEELEQLVEHLTKCINKIKEIENKNEG